MWHLTRSETGRVSGMHVARRRASRRLIMASLALAVVLMACSTTDVNPFGGGNTPAPNGYACGTTQHPTHCYAQVAWTGGAPYTGIALDLTAAALTCAPTDCYDHYTSSWPEFIANDLALVDETTGGWLAAGYETYPLMTSDYSQEYIQQVWYFWSEQRPPVNINPGTSTPTPTPTIGQPGSASFHWLGQVPSDAMRQWAHYDIHQTGPLQYTISINQIRSANGTVSYTTVDTGNTLAPDELVIGQELFGNNGATAPFAFYANAQGYDTTFTAHVETDVGAVRHDDPPFGKWLLLPPSAPGGLFETNCCAAP